ncbi:glycosyltransferase family 2 protein [Rhizobium sp. L1K21]|uniref:glycosyltransferase family 2 protein n=1 Tax=Rhizobium sp. L1K21 TaxID=2954933 RepID=UPI002093AF9E|nr:glycosyltransferase family 2 protein [Rhizobium sp. L1K21]MCO6187965.1 glycosyltransferase family 2 protein [Rhizobium sp. L1K21]
MFEIEAITRPDRSGQLGERPKLPCLAVVVPCYNEEDMLPITFAKLEAFLQSVIDVEICASESYIVFVDDGSKDRTWSLIVEQSDVDPDRFRGIKLAANVGHQNALLSGLHYVTDNCDICVSIDADLQDDLKAIKEMIAAYQAGAELVLGVRRSRNTDTSFKRNTARGFYKFMKWLGVNLVEDHADFRLMSNVALQNLKQYPERNLFLRGIVPILHQDVAYVYYDRLERLAGVSKYPLSKMLMLAWNGVTSFSVKPLRVITSVGLLVFACSLILTIYALIGAMIGITVPGWASTVIPIYLMGGLNMSAIGILGEYIGKIFIEVKHRPRFVVDRLTAERSPLDGQ